jgi:hypothetical protein
MSKSKEKKPEEKKPARVELLTPAGENRRGKVPAQVVDSDYRGPVRDNGWVKHPVYGWCETRRA